MLFKICWHNIMLATKLRTQYEVKVWLKIQCITKTGASPKQLQRYCHKQRIRQRYTVRSARHSVVFVRAYLSICTLTLQRYRHNRSVVWANPQSTMTQNSRVSRLPRLPRIKLALHSTNCLFWHDMWLVTSSSQLFNVLLTLLLAVNLSNHIDATSTNYQFAWMKVTWLLLRRLLYNFDSASIPVPFTMGLVRFM